MIFRRKIINPYIDEIADEDERLAFEESRIDRRNKRVLAVFMLISIVLIFVASDVIRTFYHENVHGAIFDAYGVSYTKGYDFSDWMTGTITFYVQANTTEYRERCNETCSALQIENETFSYNTSTIFYTIWSIFFLSLLKRFLYGEQWKNQ